MKKLVLFIMAFQLIFGCQDNDVENFPAEPHIDLVEVTFDENPEPSNRKLDNLRIVLSFTDGDEDFGLDRENPVHMLPPYHDRVFYMKGTGEPVSSDKYYNWEVDDDELIRYSDRQMVPYDTLPEDRVNCYYHWPRLDINDPMYWKPIEDPIYWRPNMDHYNLIVDFYVEQPNGTFVKYDWFQEHCALVYGRVFTGEGESWPFQVSMQSSKKGVITFNLEVHSLRTFLGDSRIKLRIYVKDRALHQSNVVETDPFYLNDI